MASLKLVRSPISRVSFDSWFHISEFLETDFPGVVIWPLNAVVGSFVDLTVKQSEVYPSRFH